MIILLLHRGAGRSTVGELQPYLVLRRIVTSYHLQLWIPSQKESLLCELGAHHGLCSIWHSIERGHDQCWLVLLAEGGDAGR